MYEFKCRTGSADGERFLVNLISDNQEIPLRNALALGLAQVRASEPEGVDVIETPFRFVRVQLIREAYGNPKQYSFIVDLDARSEIRIKPFSHLRKSNYLRFVFQGIGKLLSKSQIMNERNGLFPRAVINTIASQGLMPKLARQALCEAIQPESRGVPQRHIRIIGGRK